MGDCQSAWHLCPSSNNVLLVMYFCTSVLQTYTYAVRPVDGGGTGAVTVGEGGPGASLSLTQSPELLESRESPVASWEVRGEGWCSWL